MTPIINPTNTMHVTVSTTTRRRTVMNSSRAGIQSLTLSDNCGKSEATGSDFPLLVDLASALPAAASSSDLQTVGQVASARTDDGELQPSWRRKCDADINLENSCRPIPQSRRMLRPCGHG